jgi:hypothetical protein
MARTPDDEDLGPKEAQLSVRMHTKVHKEYSEWCHDHRTTMAAHTYQMILKLLGSTLTKK